MQRRARTAFAADRVGRGDAERPRQAPRRRASALATRGAPGPQRVRLPDPPGEQRAQPGHLARAGRPELGRLHRLDRRERCTCTRTSARTPATASPTSSSARNQPKVPIKFSEYGGESDPGPYPIPPGAPVEGAGEEGDRHVLVLQDGSCKLYELYAAQRTGAAGKPARGRSSTCAATRCARKAGPRPTRPGCRSSRCSRATRRCAPGASTTRCA